MADLRPMELGEVLDGAFTLYRRHFLLFLQLGVIALWLPVALQVYVQLSGGQTQHIGLYFTALVIQYFGGLFLTAGAIRIISDSYLGRDPTLGDALGLGAAKIWPLFLVGLGKGILLGLLGGVIGIAVGLSFALIKMSGVVGVLVALGAGGVGVWFFVYVLCGYAVTTQVVVLEELDGSFDAFGRSWDLTRGLWRKVLALGGVIYLIYFVAAMALAAPAGIMLATNPAAAQIIGAVSAVLPIVLTPLLPCVFTLMYYDLRVRREAFDLQILGQQLGPA